MRIFGRILLLAVASILTAGPAVAQYDPGTVFVVRIGANSNSANVGGANVANGVNIVPYQFNGSSWASGTPLSASPTGAAALTISNNATSEGALTLNGQYLGLAGYRTGTNGSGTDRVIARVDVTAGSFSGTAAPIDTTTAIPNAEGYGGNNVRSAIWSTDGSRYWAAGTGTGGGTRTNTFGTTSGSTQVSASPTNTRVVAIANGNLYTSSASVSFVGINQVGTGLPTILGNITANLFGSLSGTGTPSPYGFVFSPDMLTAYVADDRSIASGGGIQKWTRLSTLLPFTLSATFGTGAGSTVGARGLAVDFNTPSPTIYAVTADGSNNRLITFTDADPTTVTVIASSGTNDIFRGVAVIPVPEPGMVLAAAGLGLAGAGRRVTRRPGRGS